MNMFWNRKLSSEWGSGAVVHMLRAATIAAVVSSCSTSPPKDSVVLAQAEEPAIPPLVMLLDPDSSLAAEIKNYAWNAYQELPPEDSPYQDLLIRKDQLQIAHVTITWIDVNDEERLLSLAATVPNPNNTSWEANIDTFVIPRPPGDDTARRNFRNVTGIDTQSPATYTYCNRNIGGTKYSCSF